MLTLFSELLLTFLKIRNINYNSSLRNLYPEQFVNLLLQLLQVFIKNICAFCAALSLKPIVKLCVTAESFN